MKQKSYSAPRPIAATLTVGPVVPVLLRMSLSMLIGFIAGAAFNIADTYFVSKLGTAQLAAMGYTFPIVMTVFGLVMGIGVGTSSVLARLIGQEDERGTRQLTLHALLLGLVLTVIFISTGWVFLPRILTILGADSVTRPLALDYLHIWLAGMLFLVIPMIGNNAIRATGDTLTPSLIMLVDMCLNIVLDPAFIFGFGPIPAMGIRGAALATVIARAAALVASLIVLRRAKHLLAFERVHWHALLNSWRQILFVGLPVGATNLLMPIAAGILTRLISAFGVTCVAAFSAGVRIEHCIVIPVLALGASLVPFVGQNWGAKCYDRVHKSMRASFLVCLIWGGFCWIILGVFADSIAPLFSHDEKVVKALVIYLRIVPIAMALRGISFTSCGGLNAIGKSLHATVLTTVRLFGVQLPFVLVGSHFGGYVGILVGVVVSEIMACGITLTWLRRIFRIAAV